MNEPYANKQDWETAAPVQLHDYWELTKPRLVSLVLLSTFVGFFLASRGPWQPALLFATLAGTALTAAAAMVLNQWMERDLDGLMPRTMRRPIPAGRVEPEEALGFGLALAVLGLAILEVAVNTMASFIAMWTLCSYLFLYTPLKRVTPWCTLVGAIPGALPPLTGWAAAAGHVASVEAWTMFAILFLWQMPHFYAIATLYREDYRKANIRVLSVQDPDGRQCAAQSIFFALLLLPVSLLPTFLGLTGLLYFFGALFLGILLLYVSVRYRNAMERGARILFRVSVIYLSLLYLLMIVDKA